MLLRRLFRRKTTKRRSGLLAPPSGTYQLTRHGEPVRTLKRRRKHVWGDTFDFRAEFSCPKACGVNAFTFSGWSPVKPLPGDILYSDEPGQRWSVELVEVYAFMDPKDMWWGWGFLTGERCRHVS